MCEMRLRDGGHMSRVHHVMLVPQGGDHTHVTHKLADESKALEVEAGSTVQNEVPNMAVSALPSPAFPRQAAVSFSKYRLHHLGQRGPAFLISSQHPRS